MGRPRLLDLFCCEGGAGHGYALAGFDVTGVDITDQPNYPYRFVRADALAYVAEHGTEYDVIHASPPCQGYSTMTSAAARARWPRLIAPTRAALAATGRPWLIENVEGARRHLDHPVKLCGSGLGLAVRRHRYFETTLPLMGAPCAHGTRVPFGVYGGHGDRGQIYRRPGTGHRRSVKVRDLAHAREVMGMPWASWRGVVEAIPPAYTLFLGEQIMALIGADNPPV